MKIFKNRTLDEASNKSGGLKLKMFETIVTKSHDHERPFNVYQRLPNTVSYLTLIGNTVNFKSALEIAETSEKPTMIDNGYEVVNLGANSLIVYYGMYEPDIQEYINQTRQTTFESYKVGETGILVRFIQPQEIELKESTRNIQNDEMFYFGQYLLSNDRRKLFSSHPEFGDTNLEERLKQVDYSDIEHFNVWRKSKGYILYNENAELIEVANKLQSEDQQALVYFMKMCEESLPPEVFKLLDTEIIPELSKNRKGLH